MSTAPPELIQVALSDDRYAVEAYEFLCHSLAYTQRMLGKEPSDRDRSGDDTHHVTGQQLLEGVRRHALDRFGMMAYIVFRSWGIEKTDDFGNMVYRLIEAGLWHRSDDDRLEDFAGLYDFEQVFVREFALDSTDLACES